MDERIILDMVRPYLQKGSLTYNEFEVIFDMLSLKEQYAVLDILDRNQIELRDSNTDSDEEDILMSESAVNEQDDIEMLYDDSIFSDDVYNDEEEKRFDTSFLLVRRKVELSNRTLIKMIQGGDAQSKQDFCIKNRGLVDKYVNKYQNMLGNKLSFEDLEQSGMIGMIKAAERFDFDLGTEFSTYAVWWIRQSIEREIYDHGYDVRIPVHKMDQIQKVVRLDSQHLEESDYNKRLKIISNEAQLPVDIVEDCLRLYYQFIRTQSLDMPVGEDEDTTLGELIPIKGEDSVEEIVMRKALGEQLERALDSLNDRERTIIRMRFGMDDGREHTLEEIASEFNVTRERIRQIEAKVLKKLRHPSRGYKLRDFLD